MNRSLFYFGIVLAVLAPLAAPADVGPPAHLRISETEPGLFVTQWRVPRSLPQRAVPVPDLPATCEPVGNYSVEEQARAWLFTQGWRCEGGLAGESVGMRYPFADLALTTVVRVNLLSGDRFAHVLTAGEGPWRLPRGTAPPDHLREIARTVGSGATHVFGSWAHLPFLLAAGLLGGALRAVRVVTGFTLGQLLGVVAALAIPAPGAIPAEIAVGVAAALLAREALKEPGDQRRLFAVAAVAGVVHGLALCEGGASVGDQLLALLGMDAGHLVGATAVAFLVGLVSRDRPNGAVTRGLAYVAGAAGIALALGLALGGGDDAPTAERLDVAPPVGLEASGGAPVPGSRRLAPAVSDDPIQSFLVIEPFELRHEAMIRLGGLAGTLGLDPDSVVEVSDQAALIDRLIGFVDAAAAVSADGLELQARVRRADFMTVDPAGALPRTFQVPEKVSQAVVGVVIAYPFDGMPGEVSLNWKPFPDAVATLPATVIDPEAVEAVTLSTAEPELTWENQLAEDPIPTVSAVEVEPRRLPVPLVSLALLALAAVAVIAGIRRGGAGVAMATARVVLVLALLAGPLARTTVALPASAGGAPSEGQARRILAGLLPNVYRALEFRDELLIYDELAVSVTGESLAEIYLQQRRTLELEERGGAQARVESVEILEAGEIQRAETGFRVRAIWTVGGLVTHFGHRHFRQNRYDAWIEIVPVSGAWKIRTVEILEQERLK